MHSSRSALKNAITAPNNHAKLYGQKLDQFTGHTFSWKSGLDTFTNAEKA